MLFSHFHGKKVGGLEPVAGYSGWWDANEITGKNDGDTMTQWDDESGNSNHLANVLGTPTYETNEINTSLPCVRFNGSSALSVDFTLAQPATVILVFKQASYTYNDNIFDTAVAAYGMTLFNRTTEPEINMYAGATGTEVNGAAVGSWGVVSCLFNGASSTLRFNGSSTGPFNVGAGGGSGFTIAARQGNANPSEIDVAEILVYNSGLSAADQGITESYLNDKYSVY